jgi:hypothetical protein
MASWKRGSMPRSANLYVWPPSPWTLLFLLPNSQQRKGLAQMDAFISNIRTTNLRVKGNN